MFGFSLAQASFWRRDYELYDEAGVRVAVLHVPVVRSGARAEAAGDALHIERDGSLRPSFVLREDSSSEAVATLRRDGRRRIFEVAGRAGDWGRLGRKGWGAVDAGGTTIVAARVRGGLVHVSGEIEVAAELSRRQAVAAAVLAAYLAIKRLEDDQGSTVAATSSATS